MVHLHGPDTRGPGFVFFPGTARPEDFRGFSRQHRGTSEQWYQQMALVLPTGRHRNYAGDSDLLFQILHLFAKLLDHTLEFETDIGKVEVIGFGAQSIRFAVKLL
jgi:hypothetical protein